MWVIILILLLLPLLPLAAGFGGGGGAGGGWRCGWPRGPGGVVFAVCRSRGGGGERQIGGEPGPEPLAIARLGALAREMAPAVD